MPDAPTPTWSDELRRRYLRGESSVFLLHGNVHDLTLLDGKLVGLSDYLGKLLEKKDVVLRYNVSTGCKFLKKNARIADGVVITPEGKPPNFDGDNYFIRDGIVVVPKNAVIPAGFWI